MRAVADETNWSETFFVRLFKQLSCSLVESPCGVDILCEGSNLSLRAAGRRRYECSLCNSRLTGDLVKGRALVSMANRIVIAAH